MNDVSKEFKLNPLMTLLPKEGDLGILAQDLDALIARQEEIKDILSNVSSSGISTTDSTEIDSSQVKELTEERDMIEVVRKWIGR